MRLNSAIFGFALRREKRSWPKAAYDDPAPHFAALRAIAARNGVGKLSMGMSDDFEIAIAQGATSVRVGSAIFGVRG